MSAHSALNNTVGTLDIDHCVVQNFNSTGGIILQHTSGTPVFRISHTVTSHNTGFGVIYTAPTGNVSASITFDHLNATDNGGGIAVSWVGAASGDTVNTIVSNSVASGNRQGGMSFVGPAIKANVHQSHADQNSSTGYLVGGDAVLTIGRSVAASNGSVGLGNASGTVLSRQDNRFDENVSAATAGTIGTTALQ